MPAGPRAPGLTQVKDADEHFRHIQVNIMNQSSTQAGGTAAVASPEPYVLDVRPIFARGESPCSIIEGAVAGLAPGQTFVLVAGFEPIPLFTKLGNLGFDHQSQALPDGSYRIEFTPKAEARPADIVGTVCGCPSQS